jgi:hypothetical protein
MSDEPQAIKGDDFGPGCGSMKLFDDDFIQLGLGGLRYRPPFWPPPLVVKPFGEDKLYVQVSMSEITDEQREKMTHVCRGSLYREVKIAEIML